MYCMHSLPWDCVAHRSGLAWRCAAYGLAGSAFCIANLPLGAWECVSGQVMHGHVTWIRVHYWLHPWTRFIKNWYRMAIKPKLYLCHASSMSYLHHVLHGAHGNEFLRLSAALVVRVRVWVGDHLTAGETLTVRPVLLEGANPFLHIHESIRIL